MYFQRFLGLCDVETGQSNIILDIEESRGKCKSFETTLNRDLGHIYLFNYHQTIKTPLHNLHHLQKKNKLSVEKLILFLAIGQETTPAELPIVGEPNVDIFLDLSFPKGPPLFFLNGKKLQLLAPLDRDENNLSHIVFQVNYGKKIECSCVIVTLSNKLINNFSFVHF